MNTVALYEAMKALSKGMSVRYKCKHSGKWSAWFNNWENVIVGPWEWQIMQEPTEFTLFKTESGRWDVWIRNFDPHREKIVVREVVDGKGVSE